MRHGFKIILALLVAAVIIAGGYLALKVSGKKVSYEATLPSFEAVQNADLSLAANAQDSDKDGLTDWEEVLWKTDPQKADSDADGISDGDEVKANRDPSVKGAGNLPTKNDTDAPVLASNTATSKLASDILTAYAKLKVAEQAGTQADVPTPEELIKANTVTISAPQYSASSFSAVADSRETGARYATALAVILNKYASQNEKGELEIMATALENNDPKGLSQLQTIAARYRLMVADLRAVAVPRGALVTHTDFVNVVSNMAESTDVMREMFTDPAKGLAALKLYNDASTIASERLIDIETYFDFLEQTFPLP